MSSATEGTVNSLMAQYLNSKGIETTAEVSGFVGSTRQQVDFQITEGGEYNGEGEWQSSYIEGYNQAIGYGELPGASGYFLIGYPDNLSENIQQQRLSGTDPETLLSGVTYRGMFKTPSMIRPSIFEGKLEEIPDWIRESIQDKPREDTEEYVNLMRDMVSVLTRYIPNAEDYPSVFEHIIGDMPQEDEEFEAAQDAAAYLLLNQIVFYRILEDQGYDPIEPDAINHPEDLHDVYFSEVLEENYEAIFDLDVVSFIPQNAVQYIRDLVGIVDELRPEEFTTDLLGSAFHELIPLEVRKPVAAYYTNPMAARLLSKITIQSGDASVADFACGSGTLLMAAYDRKDELTHKEMSEDLHRDFVEEQLTGIDIMPFAAHLAAVQLGLRNPGYFTDKPRIAIRDSSTLKPDTTIGALQQSLPSGQSRIDSGWSEEELEEQEVSHGAISSAGEGTEFEVNQMDAVLMNPPFTRKQHITSKYRRELQRRFSEYSEYIDEGMGYFCYFFLLADRFLEVGGRLGMVIPSSVLQQQSTEGIRRLLQDSYNLEHIVLTDYRSAFSEDTSRREILLIAEKHDQNEPIDTPVCISSLNVLPNSGNIDTLATCLSSYSIPDDSEEMLELVELPQSDFNESLDWMAIVREHVDFYFDYPNEDRMSRFDSQYESIIRGIRYHTSSEKVHPEETLLSKDRDASVGKDWEVLSDNNQTIKAQSQYTAATVEFPKDALGRAIRSVSGQRTMQVKDAPDYIVLDRFRDDDQFWKTDTPTETLKKRKSHVDKRLSHLLLPGAGNLDLTADGTSFLAIVSEQPIVSTWTFNAVSVSSLENAKLLALWWNSTFSVAKLLVERTEVRGSLMQWRQSDLKDLPVPDLSKLTDSEKKELLTLYEEVASEPFPSLIEQFEPGFEPRRKIDEKWASILKWDYYTDKKELTNLYDQIGKFLQQLEEQMGRD